MNISNMIHGNTSINPNSSAIRGNRSSLTNANNINGDTIKFSSNVSVDISDKAMQLSMAQQVNLHIPPSGPNVSWLIFDEEGLAQIDFPSSITLNKFLVSHHSFYRINEPTSDEILDGFSGPDGIYRRAILTQEDLETRDDKAAFINMTNKYYDLRNWINDTFEGEEAEKHLAALGDAFIHAIELRAVAQAFFLAQDEVFAMHMAGIEYNIDFNERQFQFKRMLTETFLDIGSITRDFVMKHGKINDEKSMDMLLNSIQENQNSNNTLSFDDLKNAREALSENDLDNFYKYIGEKTTLK